MTSNLRSEGCTVCENQKYIWLFAPVVVPLRIVLYTTFYSLKEARCTSQLVYMHLKEITKDYIECLAYYILKHQQIYALLR